MNNGVRKAALGALCFYAAAAAAVLLISGKLIPCPLAEYLAFAYTYRAAGKIFLFVVFAALFAASLALCFACVNESAAKKPYIYIPALVFVAADLGVHGYAFLAARGYQWNYLICAILDAVLVTCVIFGAISGRKEAKK